MCGCFVSCKHCASLGSPANLLGSKLPFDELGLWGKRVTQPGRGGNMQWERGPRAGRGSMGLASVLWNLELFWFA